MGLPSSLLTRVKRAALSFDAWVNSGLFDGGRSLAAGYGRFSALM